MQIVKLIFWIIFCQLPAWAGAAAVSRGLDWYHGLVRPSFTPPDWAFSAAWGVLYILMGVAGFFLTRQGLLWTPVFFGKQAPDWALCILTGLIVANAFLLKQLWGVCRRAFWLLVPYMIWLAFAWCLNGAIILLN